MPPHGSLHDHFNEQTVKQKGTNAGKGLVSVCEQGESGAPQAAPFSECVPVLSRHFLPLCGWKAEGQEG